MLVVVHDQAASVVVHAAERARHAEQQGGKQAAACQRRTGSAPAWLMPTRQKTQSRDAMETAGQELTEHNGCVIN